MVEAAAKSIYQISVLLLRKQATDELGNNSTEVQKTLSWFVNQLGWFSQNADEIKDDHSFDALVETAAKIGLQAVEVGNTEIACTSIEVIEWLAKSYADKANVAYYERFIPRIMKRACFVGLLAFKQEMTEPLKLLKETVAEFDVKAKEQAGEELKGAGEAKKITCHWIEDEVGELYEICTHEKFNNHPLEISSQHTLFTLIECKDIDDFCEEIW